MSEWNAMGALILGCIIIFILGAVTGVLCDRNVGRSSWPEQVNRWEYGIPSPVELQQFLGVNDDGIIGPATMDAWVGYIHDEKAKEYFDGDHIRRTETGQGR